LIDWKKDHRAQIDYIDAHFFSLIGGGVYQWGAVM